jgi:hypothetical protein
MKSGYLARFPCGHEVTFTDLEEAIRTCRKLVKAKACCKIGHDLFRVFDLESQRPDWPAFAEDSMTGICWCGKPCDGNKKHPTPPSTIYVLKDGRMVVFRAGLRLSSPEKAAQRASRLPDTPPGDPPRWYIHDPVGAWRAEQARMAAQKNGTCEACELVKRSPVGFTFDSPKHTCGLR